MERGCIVQTMTASDAKTAVVSILSEDSFVGEDALSGAPHATGAAALLKSVVIRFHRAAVLRELRTPGSSLGDALMRHLIQRNADARRDLADLKLHACEARLARVLYLLARLDRIDAEAGVAPRLSQEELSQIVGTTRPRIGLFLKHFRSAGHTEPVRGGLLVRRSIEREVRDPEWAIPASTPAESPDYGGAPRALSLFSYSAPSRPSAEKSPQRRGATA